MRKRPGIAVQVEQRRLPLLGGGIPRDQPLAVPRRQLQLHHVVKAERARRNAHWIGVKQKVPLQEKADRNNGKVNG